MAGQGSVVLGIVLVGLSLLGIGASVVVSGSRQLTPLESALAQVFNLGVGILGSFLIARISAQRAAREVLRPAARSAFRRTRSLYGALGGFVREIETRRAVLDGLKTEDGTVTFDRIGLALDVLRAQVSGQIQTANDAMEDWRDLVPEEVAAMERGLLQQSGHLASVPAQEAGDG